MNSAQEFYIVGDDTCHILWDARTGSSPVVKENKIIAMSTTIKEVQAELEASPTMREIQRDVTEASTQSEISEVEDQLINKQESVQDKGHVFKSLHTSGLVPPQGNVIAHRLDGIWLVNVLVRPRNLHPVYCFVTLDTGKRHDLHTQQESHNKNLERNISLIRCGDYMISLCSQFS
ncbi:hypothetical protein LXL04_033266 [Taraxacum kok-saghyz]